MLLHFIFNQTKVSSTFVINQSSCSSSPSESEKRLKLEDLFFHLDGAKTDFYHIIN